MMTQHYQPAKEEGVSCISSEVPFQAGFQQQCIHNSDIWYTANSLLNQWFQISGSCLLLSSSLWKIHLCKLLGLLINIRREPWGKHGFYHRLICAASLRHEGNILYFKGIVTFILLHISTWGPAEDYQYHKSYTPKPTEVLACLQLARGQASSNQWRAKDNCKYSGFWLRFKEWDHSLIPSSH